MFGELSDAFESEKTQKNEVVDEGRNDFLFNLILLDIDIDTCTRPH